MVILDVLVHGNNFIMLGGLINLMINKLYNKMQD